MKTDMSYTSREISPLIIIDPKTAKKFILLKLREAGMHKGNAAKNIGCSIVTLLRWIERLELGDQIDQMIVEADKKGWRYNGRTGRPAVSERRNRRKTRAISG